MIMRRRSSQTRSYVAPAPHRRELKVLISPSLQEGVEGLSVGMTILPPGESSSFHSHEVECETWIVASGEGEVRVGDEREPVGPENSRFPEEKCQTSNHQYRPAPPAFAVDLHPTRRREKSILEGKMK